MRDKVDLLERDKLPLSSSPPLSFFVTPPLAHSRIYVFLVSACEVYGASEKILCWMVYFI